MRSALLLLLIAVLVLLSVADAAEVRQILYREDFSSDPLWETNNPRTNYWDSQFQRFHYHMQDATGAYVFKKVPYTGGSFWLEFDLRQMRSDRDSNLRFGLGDRDMFPDTGSTLYIELSNGKEGRLFEIVSIDRNNCRIRTSSHRSSYGGTTVQFVDNVTYHMVLNYNAELGIATVAVEKDVDGAFVWKHTLSGIEGYSGLDRIYLSARNDIENWESAAEGIIDNVYLYSYAPLSGAGQPAEEATPELVRPTPFPSSPPLSTVDRTPPVPSPRAAASALLPLLALTSALVLMAATKARKR